MQKPLQKVSKTLLLCCAVLCCLQLLPALQEQAQNLQLQYRNTGGHTAGFCTAHLTEQFLYDMRGCNQ
jgi:hypothetical protein